jgi:hypothetical protein
MVVADALRFVAGSVNGADADGLGVAPAKLFKLDEPGRCAPANANTMTATRPVAIVQTWPSVQLARRASHASIMPPG